MARVTPPALNYLYLLGTATGSATLRTLSRRCHRQARRLWHHLAARDRGNRCEHRLRASQRSRVAAAGCRRGESALVGLRQCGGADRCRPVGRGGIRRTARTADAGSGGRRGTLVRHRLPPFRLFNGRGANTYNSRFSTRRLRTIAFAPLMTAPFARPASRSCSRRRSSGLPRSSPIPVRRRSASPCFSAHTPG